MPPVRAKTHVRCQALNCSTCAFWAQKLKLCHLSMLYVQQNVFGTKGCKRSLPTQVSIEKKLAILWADLLPWKEREREKESSEKVYDGQTGGTWCLNQRHAIIFDSSACIQHVCSVCLFVAFPVCVGLAEHVNMNRLSTCAVRGEFFTAECPFKSKLRLSSARKGHSDLYTLYRNPGKGAIVAQACAGGQPQKQGAKPACTSETEKKRRDTPRPCVSLCVWGSQRLIWTNDKHISVIGRRDNICLQKIIMIITKCSKYLQYDYDTVEKNDVFWTATCATISLKRRSAPEIAAEICPSASAHCILQWSWQGQLN